MLGALVEDTLVRRVLTVASFIPGSGLLLIQNSSDLLDSITSYRCMPDWAMKHLGPPYVQVPGVCIHRHGATARTP